MYDKPVVDSPNLTQEEREEFMAVLQNMIMYSQNMNMTLEELMF